MLHQGIVNSHDFFVQTYGRSHHGISEMRLRYAFENARECVPWWIRAWRHGDSREVRMDLVQELLLRLSPCEEFASRAHSFAADSLLA